MARSFFLVSVLVIFRADVFLDFPTRLQFIRLLSRDRLGESHRVFDGHVIRQRVMIDPSNALDQMHGFAMRKSAVIDPGFIFETYGVHNQRVVFPSPN